MGKSCGSGGEGLTLLAALVSFQLAQGRTNDQIELISAFFEVLGDNLSLIAAVRSTSPCPCEGGSDAPSSPAAQT